MERNWSVLLLCSNGIAAKMAIDNSRPTASLEFGSSWQKATRRQFDLFLLCFLVVFVSLFVCFFICFVFIRSSLYIFQAKFSLLFSFQVLE